MIRFGKGAHLVRAIEHKRKIITRKLTDFYDVSWHPFSLCFVLNARDSIVRRIGVIGAFAAN